MASYVRKSPAALLDLRQQATYYSNLSSQLTERFLTSAEATFALLLANPELGTRYAPSHGRLSDLRMWSMSEFPKHVVFYQPVDEDIVVVRVLDGARDVDVVVEDD